MAIRTSSRITICSFQSEPSSKAMPDTQDSCSAALSKAGAHIPLTMGVCSLLLLLTPAAFRTVFLNIIRAIDNLNSQEIEQGEYQR